MKDHLVQTLKLEAGETIVFCKGFWFQETDINRAMPLMSTGAGSALMNLAIGDPQVK